MFDKRLRPTRGFTLLELLIVMAILLAVTAAAIPVLAPAVQGRKTREASRTITSFIAQARTKAIELGRPVGVMFERMENNRLACNRLSMVEVPPVYAGESIGDQVQVTMIGDFTDLTGMPPSVLNLIVPSTSPAASQSCAFRDYVFINFGTAATYAGLRVGDVIRSGPNEDYEYTLLGPDGDDPSPNGLKWGAAGNGRAADGILDTEYAGGGGINEYLAYRTRPAPWNRLTPKYPPTPTDTPVWMGLKVGTADLPAARGVPYSVSRQPQRTSVGTLQLQEGTCIDLYWSGVETGGTLMLDPASLSPGSQSWTPTSFLDNPIIMFSPSGAVDSMYVGGKRLPVSANFYLLVGRPEGMAFTYQGSSSTTSTLNDRTDKKFVENLVDTNNQWVTVAPATGRVVALENAAYKDPASGISLSQTDTTQIQIMPGNAAGSSTQLGKMQTEVIAARQLAITGQQISGN